MSGVARVLRGGKYNTTAAVQYTPDEQNTYSTMARQGKDTDEFFKLL